MTHIYRSYMKWYCLPITVCFVEVCQLRILFAPHVNADCHVSFDDSAIDQGPRLRLRTQHTKCVAARLFCLAPWARKLNCWVREFRWGILYRSLQCYSLGRLSLWFLLNSASIGIVIISSKTTSWILHRVNFAVNFKGVVSLHTPWTFQKPYLYRAWKGEPGSDREVCIQIWFIERTLYDDFWWDGSIKAIIDVLLITERTYNILNHRRWSLDSIKKNTSQSIEAQHPFHWTT